MKRRTVFLLVVAVILVLIAGGYLFISQNLKQLAKTPVHNIDLSTLSDGVYTGSYSSFPVSATVKVTIADHRMVNIALVEHQNGKGGAAEAIPEKVVSAQSLQVDAVSGATYSSKVILLAIEDALSHPPN